MIRLIVAFVVLTASTIQVAAQDRVFLQIAARPTLDAALQDLRSLSREFDDIGGFRLKSGWYAIAIGPYQRNTGEAELLNLKTEARIPADSFLASPGDFRRQFWPIGTNALSRNADLAAIQSTNSSPALTASQDPATVPAQEPIDETPREARASERRLDREAREELQRALSWFGHYTAAIDGDIGPGSRAAMAKWQAEKGVAQTGVLTTRQRTDLLGLFNGELAALGLGPVTDEAAGITIDMPKGQVTYARTQAPFVHYEGTGDNPARVVLISQAGDRTRLRSLFDVLQTLEIVPLGASANFSRTRFEISGEDDTKSTHITASLAEDGIKGFALVWPKNLPGNAARIAAAMQTGFDRIDDVVLSEDAGLLADQNVDLMAGLDIRRPLWVRSAVFVDDQGRALSIGNDLSGCNRLTLGDDVPATATGIGGQNGSDLNGITLIVPSSEAVPLDFARFATGPTRIGSDIFMSGFAYGGRLSEPSVTTGKMSDIKGLEGETGISRMQLTRANASVGGPVFDTTGAVVGLVQPPIDGLPTTTRMAVSAAELVDALDANGIQTWPSIADEVLLPEDIGSLAADITAKLACWEN